MHQAAHTGPMHSAGNQAAAHTCTAQFGSHGKPEAAAATDVKNTQLGADGAVLLKPANIQPLRAPVPGAPGHAWEPTIPLPAKETGGRPVQIFYSPHPDDETLSMSVLITQAVQRGERVIVVALTNGHHTVAIREVNKQLGVKLTDDDIARVRAKEVTRAAAKLGVQPADIYLAHLDASDTDCGVTLSVAEVRQLMDAFARQFPKATHITMSDVADNQKDHGAAGKALRDAVRAKTISSAKWTVSRLWWTLPSANPRWAFPVNGQARAAIGEAAAEYRRWDPKQDMYGVGWHSVAAQFNALLRDPRNRWHQ